MRNTNAASSTQDIEQKTVRTQLTDLAPLGYELSKDELKLVAGGVGTGKQPGDDDATYAHGYHSPWD